MKGELETYDSHGEMVLCLHENGCYVRIEDYRKLETELRNERFKTLDRERRRSRDAGIRAGAIKKWGA